MEFLHGMLEGMASIEARAYALLSELGADPLTKVTDRLVTPGVLADLSATPVQLCASICCSAC